MTHENMYLYQRGRRWHFMRRVPELFRSFDRRNVIRRSLRTASVLVARARRDALVAADDEYWAAMAAVDPATAPEKVDAVQKAIARRHEAACLRAVTQISIGSGPDTIIRDLAISQLAARVDAIALGGQTSAFACKPESAARAARLTEALELYVERIALRDLINKSADQRRAWRQALDRAVKNFAHVAGDRPVGAIIREDAMKFYVWWAQRLKPKLGGKALTSASANRELGALRKLYREYFEYFGEIDVVNPFKGLSFKRMPSVKAPPFDDEWVRDRILKPGALNHMRQEARRLIYVFIETGARTSEIANLTTDDIILSTDAPFIKIRPRKGRELKTHSSIRDIPLVGVALEAMRRQPKGFPGSRDQSSQLSAYLMKSLRNADLMPTPAHRIYSFRHAFEKRMLEAGIDYELRCRLMGHAEPRPSYGGGGSITFRRDQLLKIAHPYEEGLFD